MNRSSVVRKARAWAFVAVPAIGIAELAAYVVTSRRAPDEAAWQMLPPAVRGFRREGELVVVAPRWAEPHARRVLGDEAFPVRDLARPDPSRYESAVELSIAGERSAELAGFREETRIDAGPFVLRRLTNPSPARPRFVFTDRITPDAADVRVTDPADSCRWNPTARAAAGGLGGHPTFPSQRFECPGGAFYFVGVTVIADEEFLPRRCIWAHPPPRGEIVTRFRNVPLGSVVRGHSGIYWVIERDRSGAPVSIDVRVDGELVGTATHRDGDGWAPFEIPLGAHANKDAADVELAVRSPDNRHRHFCFEADTR